jgi:hypothetical protein
MINRYSNQNHAVHRTENNLEKIASVYDKMSVSNRVKEEKPLSFSSLSPFESEGIFSSMQKQAEELEQLGLEKKANPFEQFGNAKHYISSKLGVGDEMSHNLASTVLTRAQDLQNMYGGDVDDMVTGIVDNMDKDEIHSRLGAVPMRPMSPQETEDEVENMLMQGFQLTAANVAHYKKNVMDQARNLAILHRQNTISEIATSIIKVLVDHLDVTLVNNISSSAQLKKEVEANLSQG